MLPQQILLHFVQATASKGVQHRRDALPSTRKNIWVVIVKKNSLWFSVQWYLPMDFPSWFLSHSEVVPPLVPGSLTFHHFFNPDSIRIQSGFNAPSLHQVHQQRFQCRHQPSTTTTLSCFVHGGAAEAFKLILHGTRLFTLKTLKENIWKDWRNWKCHQNPNIKG